MLLRLGQIAAPRFVQDLARLGYVAALQRLDRGDERRRRQLAPKLRHTLPRFTISLPIQVVHRAQRSVDRLHDRPVSRALGQQAQQINERLRLALIEHETDRLGANVRDLVLVDDVASQRDPQLQSERSNHAAVEAVQRAHLEPVQVLGQPNQQIERLVG